MKTVQKEESNLTYCSLTKQLPTNNKLNLNSPQKVTGLLTILKVCEKANLLNKKFVLLLAD